ncbi:MAG: CDP-alcohol phosphatidyltransferase [Hirschia sp.]|nr:CDP-alcohol phosphatidyltransferase [Hirschia sp.]MBF19493.1 CDP-alcohol phosphatidyltransferase [Hirschia sp.]
MKTMIPNLLTLARLVLAPVVAWCIWQGFSIPYQAEFGPQARDLTADAVLTAQAIGDQYKFAAAGLFVFAALTDLFDGMAARAFDADSKFGRILDPIADKALVGLPLLVLAYISGFSADETSDTLFSWSNINIWIAVPVLAIVARDLLITVLRLFAADGEGAPVMMLSKWKTTLELIAVAAPIFIALPFMATGAVLNSVWLVLLWAAAILSVLTGVIYLTSTGARREIPGEV